MKLLNKLYICLFLILLITGCNSSDSVLDNGSGCIMIDANVNRVLTRAVVAESPYTDQIGSVMLYHDNVNNTQNCEFKYDGTEWNPTTPIYWQDMTKTKLGDGNSYFVYYAVAPYPLTNANSGTVLEDQSNTPSVGNLSDLTKSDLLMSYITCPKRVGKIAVPLRHVMSQVQVILNTDNGYDSVPRNILATSDVVIDGLQTEYSLNYTSSTDSLPAAALGTGSAKTGLHPYHDLAVGDYRFIAPPQQLPTAGLKVTISYYMNGTKYTYAWRNTNPIAFKQGAITQINLRVTKSGIAFGIVSLAAWSTPTILSGTAAIVLDEGQSSSQVNSMRLWLGENNEADKAAKGRDYMYNSSSWEVADGQTPFYIETILNTDKFYAISRPDNSEADQYTNIRDVLSTSTSGEHMDQATGRLSLAFNHLNSQMKIALKRGEGLSERINLKTAKVQIIDYSDTQTFSGVNTTVDESVKKTTAEIPVSTSAISADVESCTPAFILMAQKFGPTAKIKVTTSERTYLLSIADLELGAGKCDSITLIVNGSSILPGSITVRDWEKVYASYQMVIDGLNPTVGTGNVTPVNGDSLIVVYANDTAKYKFDGSAWKSSAPIYWDDMPLASTVSNQYPFYVTYKMNGSYDYTSFGPEVMVYAGQATIGFGEMLNVDIAPQMSQLTIHLKKGVGYEKYTDQEFIDLLVSKKFVLTINGQTKKSFDFVDGQSYILEPQTFTNDDIITLALADGNTYTINFSKVKYSGVTWTELKKGISYDLTLNVDKTALKTDLNAVGWTVITGEGTFGY